MHYIVLFSLLAACVLAEDEEEHYSFSPGVGAAIGTPYALTGTGRITAVRVWDDNNYIYGIQFRYGDNWSERVGSNTTFLQEIELHEGEAIVQISGKYYYNYYYYYYSANSLQSLVFITSKGRALFAGQPAGSSFNMYPAHPKAELRFISGNVNSFVSSISAHWALVSEDSNESNE